MEAVLVTWVYPNAKRDKLSIQGTIYDEKDIPIYAGNMNVTGSFPFFIDRDNFGDRSELRKPNMAGKG